MFIILNMMMRMIHSFVYIFLGVFFIIVLEILSKTDIKAYWVFGNKFSIILELSSVFIKGNLVFSGRSEY